MAELTLHEKLIDIQQHLKVPKDITNSFGGFKYRNLEAIEEAVKPMLAEHKLTLTFRDEIIGVEGRVFVQAWATLYDGENYVEKCAFAQHDEHKKGMDDAQLTGSCSSYARKYAAGGLFLIDETKDADSMDNTHTSVPKTKWEPSADRPVSEQQRNTIATWLKVEGVETKEDIADYLYTNFGGLPENELQAYEVISDLEAKDPMDKR